MDHALEAISELSTQESDMSRETHSDTDPSGYKDVGMSDSSGSPISFVKQEVKSRNLESLTVGVEIHTATADSKNIILEGQQCLSSKTPDECTKLPSALLKLPSVEIEEDVTDNTHKESNSPNLASTLKRKSNSPENMNKACGSSSLSIPCHKGPNNRTSPFNKQAPTTNLESKKGKTGGFNFSAITIDSELEKKLQTFNQYVKEKEIIRSSNERTLHVISQLKCEPESEPVSLKDLILFSKPWKPVDTQSRKFKPKLPLPTNAAESDSAHLRVIVRAVENPNNIYVTLIDKEWAEYEEMHQEMQIELEVSISERPASLIGHCCAVHYQNEWHRALIEEVDKSKRAKVFLVDKGHRLTIAINDCYHLPDKFLELPAQSLRCNLDGLHPAPHKSSMNASSTYWNLELLPYLRNHCEKKGTVLIERISLGQVGKISGFREFYALCILHVDGEPVSTNRWLCDKGYAMTDRKTDIPVIEKVRTKLFAQELSRALVSIKVEKIETLKGSEPKQRKTVEVTSSNVEDSSELPSWPESPAVSLKSDGGSLCITPQEISQIFRAPILQSRSNVTRTEDGSFYEVKLNEDSNVSRRSSFSSSSSSHFSTDHFGKMQRKMSNLTTHHNSSQPIEDTCLGPLFFCWCESPNAIYVQTSEMREQYRSLMGKMQQHYRNMQSPDTRYFEIGCMCAVLCDGKWWRALLMENDEYPTCQVLLRDRGLERTVNASDIRPLEEEFEEYDKLIYRVSLKAIYPAAGKVWSKEVCQFITERLLGGEDIFLRYNKQEQTSVEFLSGTLVYTYDLEPGPLQFGGKTKLYLNYELVSVGLAAARPTPRPLKPALKLTKWKSPTYPTPGETFFAKVTWVNMEGEIFLHDVRDEPVLEKVTDWLTKKYENTLPTEADMKPKPGDLCIAKYDSDQKWYRCVVQKVNPEEDTATLLYEDYGTKDATSLRDIRLDIALEDKPLLALRCKLHNVKPVAESWDWDTLTEIHRLIVDHEFSCSVVSSYPAFTVILSRNGRSLATELFEEGLASCEQVPGPRSQ